MPETSNELGLASAVRFGQFVVDLRTGEVRKNGRKTRLQNQPFRLLTELIACSGEAVTNEELTRRLWGDAPPSDPEHSLSTAVNK